MKNLKLFGLLTIVALFFFTPQAQAINTADRAPLEAAISHQKLTKKELRQQKRMEKRLKKMQKKGIDFSDPVDKWMWYWIFGWGTALLLSIIGTFVFAGTYTLGAGFGIGGILFLLSSLAGLFGSVSLVIWLIKKFG